jgi:general secretion pathway protein D
MMRQAYAILLLMSLVGACEVAGAQERNDIQTAAESATESAGRSEGVPIERIIAAVAKKTGKKYLIDPRVHGGVQIVGQDISAITYAELLSILQLDGATAVEGGNYVSVIPETNIRQMPLPLLTGKESYPEAQWVTTVIAVRNVPAATLVPILRPLMPVYAHLAADICSNSLLATDSFAKVKLIEKLVASLDVGPAFVPHACDGESAHSGSAPHP